MSKTVSTKILLRNDTAANWTTNNPTLAKGELGVQIDTKKFKFGDGVTPWNSLDYGAGAAIPLASTSTNGLMSAADFAKLSGIEAGAQANVQSDWNAVSGDAAILNKPTTLAGYGITDAMTSTAIQAAINSAITSVFKYKGTKATVSALPNSDNTVGDVWHVTEDSSEYIWNGTVWEELGPIVDLSGYLEEISIAGITVTPSSYTITAAELQTALGLGDAAYRGVDSTIVAGSTSTNLVTAAAVSSYIAQGASRVEASSINGNIKIDNTQTTVYTLPTSTLDSSDILILDCGVSTTNYS